MFFNFCGFLYVSESFNRIMVGGGVSGDGGNVEILWESVELLDVVVRCHVELGCVHISLITFLML